jgi:recombination protein RecT
MAGQQLVKVSDLGKMFVDHSDELSALAPRGMSLERFQVGVIQAFRQKPELQRCSPISIKISIMDALAAGVIPGGMPPMGWFIPYKGECTWQTSWQGVVYQMQKYGGLKPGSLRVTPVFQGDHFELSERDGVQSMEYKLRSDTEDYTQLRGVFVSGEFDNGVRATLWVRKDTIERCRKKSKAPQGAWQTDTFGMVLKTAILQWAKDKPRTPDLEALFQREMQREYGEGWNFRAEFDPAPAIASAETAQIASGELAGNGDADPVDGKLPGMTDANPVPATASAGAKAIGN